VRAHVAGLDDVRVKEHFLCLRIQHLCSHTSFRGAALAKLVHRSDGRFDDVVDKCVLLEERDGRVLDVRPGRLALDSEGRPCDGGLAVGLHVREAVRRAEHLENTATSRCTLRNRNGRQARQIHQGQGHTSVMMTSPDM
jgi:hypothetical protein